MRAPIDEALERLVDVFGPQRGLLPTLAADAVFARLGAEVEEAEGRATRLSCCRLLELLVRNELPEPRIVADALAVAGWTGWEANEQSAVVRVFDAWWSTLLAIHPFDPTVDRALAVLCRLELPLVRWLHPLLEALDGPAAVHLSEIVLGELHHPDWEGLSDQRQQVLGWCRTESVVMGLTIVGGVHLPPGVFGSLLDKLL